MAISSENFNILVGNVYNLLRKSNHMSQLGVIEEINVAKIQHPPNQLRTRLENIGDLAQSIKQQGLLQPIVVRPKSHEYEVVAGNRRLEAVKALKLRRITCHVVELSDREAYEVALVENVHHRTMNPIEEAVAFRKYVESYGWGGISDLAQRIGKSQEFVTKRLQLLRLPEKVQQEIIRQRITASAALEMLPLDNKKIENFIDYVIENPLTREEIRRAVKTARYCDKNLDEVEELNKAFIKNEKDLVLMDNALKKSIAVMKSTLLNFDDILESVEDDWLIKEILMQYRLIMHGDIDTFLKLRKRLKTKMPRGYAAIRNQKPAADESLQELVDDPSIYMWNPKGVWQ